MAHKKQQKPYHPPQKILEKYADVLVNFALGGGKGIKKGEVVYLMVEEYAKPLYIELQKAIWRAGGHVISSYRPSHDSPGHNSGHGSPAYHLEGGHKLGNPDRNFFLLAQQHQLEFFPAQFMKGLLKDIDHSIFILSETNKQILKGIDPKKIMQRGKAQKPYMDWRTAKENAGKFTWTIGLYGTQAMATEAGLSLEAYWGEIINACFLNEKNPIAKWKAVYKDLEKYRTKLNDLKIEKVHVQGKDADLWIKIGADRMWQGGGGRNIPSFEIFTSPDWRGTEGWIRFNQPLYRYGNIIQDIRLEFKNGKVTRSSAAKNEGVLKQMIATENADKVGEFSLTDNRFSNITHFMAETLFDENMGGKYGNTHIALGMSYRECFRGNSGKGKVVNKAVNLAKIKKGEWAERGFNDSSVHTDIVSTTDRTVTAYLSNGTSKVIYKGGRFVI